MGSVIYIVGSDNMGSDMGSDDMGSDMGSDGAETIVGRTFVPPVTPGTLGGGVGTFVMPGTIGGIVAARSTTWLPLTVATKEAQRAKSFMDEERGGSGTQTERCVCVWGKDELRQ